MPSTSASEALKRGDTLRVAINWKIIYSRRTGSLSLPYRKDRDPMLLQLHWQNSDPDHCTETLFVAQSGDVQSRADMDKCMAAFNEIIERRKHECPDRWSPMVCDEGYAGFVRASTLATPQDGGQS